MHTAVIIPYRPQADHATLVWTLEGFAEQELDSGHTLEILVGIDGHDECVALPVIPASRHIITLHPLPRMGAAAVRNELARRARITPGLLIFANSDTRPAPDMVRQHACTMTGLPPKSLVLGAAPWQRSHPTVLDTLIDQTPMIFSYCHLKAHQWHSFRAAYSLNLSVRLPDFQGVGGFPEQLRPYYYEDLAFVFRVMGPERAGVYFEPRARVVHRHPLSFAQYLDREEMLGLMAPVLAGACPEVFAALMAGRSVEAIAQDFRRKLDGDKGVYPSLFRHLQEQFAQPDAILGQGDVRAQNLHRLHQLHLPLRLLAFRLGFLQGLDWAGDGHWRDRRPTGLWHADVGFPDP
jgi:hypothetical protein